jgi:hypothetical protein
MDEILKKIAKRDSFPNLKAIVVAGHSAGGRTAQRAAQGAKHSRSS